MWKKGRKWRRKEMTHNLTIYCNGISHSLPRTLVVSPHPSPSPPCSSHVCDSRRRHHPTPSDIMAWKPQTAPCLAGRELGADCLIRELAEGGENVVGALWGGFLGESCPLLQGPSTRRSGEVPPPREGPSAGPGEGDRSRLASARPLDTG